MASFGTYLAEISIRMSTIADQRSSGGFGTGGVRRVVGRFIGDPVGPTLIVVGSIHGNEPSGRRAIEQIADSIRNRNIPLHGRLFLLTGNLEAAEQRQRYIDADLNRRWTRENIVRNTPSPQRPFTFSEDREQHELLKIFRDILRTAADEVYVLDLHSTSADGVPFATVGDTMRNRRFAMRFPINIVLGIEEELEGTMLEFLNNEGAVTLGFEGGRHDATGSVANHEALIQAALVNTGIVQMGDCPRYEEFLERLKKVTGVQRIFEVRHREPVVSTDNFQMYPGFQNFDSVRKGQELAANSRGEIRSPEKGMIMMPLYQKQGDDGFFIIREVARFWLWLSAVLRALDIARFVALLPGVTKHPKRPEHLQVNTRIARLFPLHIFHLLGFRRLRWMHKFLVVSRRRFDTQSPFRHKETHSG